MANACAACQIVQAQALAFTYCTQNQAEVCDGVDAVFHGIKRCLCIYFYHIWLCTAINRCFCIFFYFLQH
nr:MAG TPA: hypothetical protein [Caudoviricetes sp.]